MAREALKNTDQASRDAAVKVAMSFFQAVKDGTDWRPFAQKHYADWPMEARPLIVMYDDFSYFRTGNIRGANPDVCLGVYVVLKVSQLPGSVPQRRMEGRVAVFCEKGPRNPSVDGTWGVAPNSFQVSAGRDSFEV